MASQGDRSSTGKVPKRDRRPRTGTGVSKIRRAEAGRWNRWSRWTKERWQQLLALDLLWVVLFLGLATWVLTPSQQGWRSGDVVEGSVAQRDFVATQEAVILDLETTEEKRSKARSDVIPVWDFDAESARRVDQQLMEAFSIGRQLVVPGVDEDGEPVPLEALADDELADAIRAGSEVELTMAQVAFFRRQQFSSELEDRLRAVFERVLEQGTVSGKGSLLENRSRGIQLRDLSTGREQTQVDLFGYLEFPGEVRDLVEREVRAWSLRSQDRNLVVDFVVANVGPNLHPNPSETQRRQDAAAEAVEQVFNRVLAGQIIVRKGDTIDQRAAEIIEELSVDPSTWDQVRPRLGVALLLGLFVLLLWFGVRQERTEYNPRPTLLGEILLLVAVSLVCARVCFLLVHGLATSLEGAPYNLPEPYFYAIPFAGLALVVVLIYGRGLAMLTALALSVLAPMVVEDSSWSMVLYCLAGSIAAVLIVEHFQVKQRSLLVRTGLAVGGVNVVTVLVLAALRGDIEVGSVPLHVGFEVFCGFAGGILVAAVVSFAVPVLESVYSVTTGLKLVELANTNLPLLRRVAFESPGTFQHSLMVANLAKAGCEAIGADSVLAYTGALYHDIGKVLRPEYFVENQRPGRNPHDKIQPSMSALIIINHVKEGLQLAKDYHLPQPILDAISQHHGTRLISFFYNRAKEMASPERGEVPEDKFRYPGPRPQGKVMGVLMLADGVEAASRTLVEPDAQKIRAVIQAITDDCLRDGQLDDTDLTLGDLKRVSEAFQLLLSHIHHQRLDYPGFDFKGRPDRSLESGDVRKDDLEEVEALAEAEGAGAAAKVGPDGVVTH